METGGNYFTMSYTALNEWDLAGNQTLGTNVEIINEQLAAKGFPNLSGLNNHETRRLPNGNLLILGSHDETSTIYQGGTQQNPVDILGDMILVLDHNMQLLWAWDSFANQDLSREATLDDLCYHLTEGCPPFNQNFTTANDWTHANAAQTHRGRKYPALRARPGLGVQSELCQRTGQRQLHMAAWGRTAISPS